MGHLEWVLPCGRGEEFLGGGPLKEPEHRAGGMEQVSGRRSEAMS